MSCTGFRFLRPRSRSQLDQRSNLYLSLNSETTEETLMKLNRKIKHDEKVCGAQDLGSYAQAQAHNQVRGQICVSAITQKLLKQI